MQNPENAEYYSGLPLPETPPVREQNAPDPNNPPWGALEAFGVWVASVLFVLLLPAFIVLPHLLSLDADFEQFGELAKNDPTSIFLQILGVIPAHIATLVLAWLVVTRAKKFSFREMLGWNGGGLSMWLLYPAILIAFFLLAYVVNLIYPEQENEMLRILRSSRSVVYIVAFVATFTAPFVEEVVYRGLLFSAFQRWFGVGGAFIFVTLLFSVVHWPQYWPSYSTIFLLTLLSLTLTAVRLKTANLLPCVILHTLFNGFQSVILILEPYLKAWFPEHFPS